MEKHQNSIVVFALSVVFTTALAISTAQAKNNSQNADNGNPSALVSSLSDIEFPPTVAGTQSTRRFILTNTGLDGGASITVFSIYLDEQDSLAFATDFDGPKTINSGESIAIEVTFTPKTNGDFTGALLVSHNGQSGLEVFTVSGTGFGASSTKTDDYSLDYVNPRTSRAVDLGRKNRAVSSKIGFGKSTLSGIGNIKPTSLQFGPDGKLYVADMLGLIKVYTIKRKKSNSYSVTQTDTISLVKNIPNHNDNGKLNKSIKNRLVTGLLVVGTASDPVLYVNSSDPRIGGGPSHKDTNLDTNSSIISRLTKKGNKWVKKDLVRGLPRSEENHHLNGMTYDPVKNHLYVAAGGNTNQGAPSQNFAKLPEFALSAAILEIDLNQIGNSTYDLPTLDDQTRSGVKDFNDPFGGNNGLNQAKLVPGGPVQIYAPGFRNAYDIVITDAGNMYTVDNGPNAGWGNSPVKEGSGGKCTNGLKEPGSTYKDSLHHITGKGYYGGHANPTRGNKNNKFNSKNPQSPVSSSNPVECDYRIPGPQSKALTLFGSSTNGLTEYRASNFGGAMQGDLLTASFNNKIYRLALKNNGKALASKSVLFSNVGKTPLDVTALGDPDIFPGTIWVADFVKKQIYVFEPKDYSSTGNGSVAPVCTGTPANADSDGDKFLNGDEIANGTNPCSAADIPDDVDNDFVSDLIDTDDDNDGIDDINDIFPLDPNNGRGTSIPLSYTWENNSGNPGFLMNMGFSGLMSNGLTSYQQQYDIAGITAGGAAGVFTVDNISSGTAKDDENDQMFAFQFGVDVKPSTPVFTVSTRIVAPFAGTSGSLSQSAGFYIGTGDQDNYVKLVVNGHNNTGGIAFSYEKNGVYQNIQQTSEKVIGASEVDLFLTIEPSSGIVTAAYKLNGNLVVLPTTVTIPQSWLLGESGMAIGIIASSGSAKEFTATWDHIEILPGNTAVVADTASQPTEEDTTDSATVGNTQPADTINGLVTIEAESYANEIKTATHQWKEVVMGGASGSAMITTPDSGTLKRSSAGSPSLSYQVNFEKAGTYSVWVRGSGDTNAKGEGKSDSVHVGINNKLGSAAAVQNFPGQWRWSRETRGGGTAKLNVPAAGVHTVNLWMREDGLAVDAVVLSLSENYVPEGSDPLPETSPPQQDPVDTNINTESENTVPGNDIGNDPADVNEPTSPSNTDVVIEAESYSSTLKTKTHQWVAVSTHAASGGKAMKTTPDKGTLIRNEKNSPVMSYKVAFAESGVYSVWVRGFGDTNAKGEGKSDSVHIGLNGALGSAAAIAKFPADWTWSNQRINGSKAKISVPNAGVHVVNVWMREDGFIFDKLLLTKSATRIPVGLGTVDGASSNPATPDVVEIDSPPASPDADTESNQPDSVPPADNAVDVDTNGLVVVEAEAFNKRINTSTHQWVSAPRSGASGGASMMTTPDSGALKRNTSNSPLLNIPAQFDQAGNYQVWVRGWGDTVGTEGRSDSLYVGINESKSSAVPVESFPAGWHWSNKRRGGGRATVVVSTPGVHDVSLWMREDGFSVDQLVLTLSSSYTPTGEEVESGSSTTPSSSTQDNAAVDEPAGSPLPDTERVSASTKWKNFGAKSGSVVPRHEAAGVLFKGKLYVLGGRGNRPVSVFDPVTSKWQTKSKAPLQLDHFQPVVWGDKILVIGAFQCCFPKEDLVPDIYSYHPASDKWQKEGAIPKSRLRGSVGAAVYKNHIYLVGGNKNGHMAGAVPWFDRYNPVTGEWKTLPSAPTARDHIQVSIADGQLVVAAGRQSAYPNTWGNMQSAVDVFDFTSGKWSKGSNIPTLRAGAMAVTVGSEVLVIGGETDKVQKARNHVEAFDIGKRTWRALKPLNVGRHGGAAVVIGNNVHVVTGNTTKGGGDETKSHEILKISP